MPALNLMAKLGLDVSGFQQAMGKVRMAAAPATKELGTQLRGVMLAGLGAQALVGEVKKSMERASEIAQGSEKYGVSAETFQALEQVAKDSGLSIDDLIDSMQSGTVAGDNLKQAVEDVKDSMKDAGTMMDEETVQALQDAKDRMQELLGRLAPLLASVAAGFVKVFDALKKGMGWLGGSVSAIWGMVTGDDEMLQAGLDTADEEWNRTPGPSRLKSSRGSARHAAISAYNAMNAPALAHQGFKPLDVSGSTAVGGYFNPQFSMATSGPERELQNVNKKLSDIQILIRRGVE